jgi:hypothetical protein
MVWAEESWDTISSILNDAFLNQNNKKNLRQLTKAEFNNLEQLKLDVLTNLELLSKADASTIYSILKDKKQTPKEFIDLLNNNNINLDSMSVEKYRRNVLGLYVEHNAFFKS